MSSFELLEQVEKHIKDLLSTETLQGRPFHNFKHTLHVVKKCGELATYYNLTLEDRKVLFIAAWFHDTGYIYGNVDHEEKSIKIASAFLSRSDMTSEFIEKVNRLILATKLPSKPENLLQEMLCDADLHHLASTDYLQWSDRLHQEIQMQGETPISDKSWNMKNISFYKTHYYFTEYAITFWNAQKQLNLEDMISQSGLQ